MNTNLLTSAELAEILQSSTSTLKSWRKSGRGPMYVKVGRLIRYRQEDVDNWLLFQRVLRVSEGQ